MTKSEKKKLYDFCLDIQAHAELDWEVTLAGNGINCAEAAHVARALLLEFNMKLDEKDVQEKVVELEKLSGYSTY